MIARESRQTDAQDLMVTRTAADLAGSADIQADHPPAAERQRALPRPATLGVSKRHGKRGFRWSWATVA